MKDNESDVGNDENYVFTVKRFTACSFLMEPWVTLMVGKLNPEIDDF